MTIWAYEQERLVESKPDRAAGFDLRTTTVCIYCTSTMSVLAGAPLGETVYKGMNAKGRVLFGCHSCGWWSAFLLDAAGPFETFDGGYARLSCSSGVLKNLDVSDISVPTDELRSYLLIKYGDRFDVHPRKYEEIVGAVFADFGFRARVTSYGGDEGIDVFVLDGKGDATVGIQVKRYRGKISAEQIRSFVGALVLQKITSGIYVTTGDYQKGAKRTATAAQDRLGLAVDLVDAKRFYDALKVTTRATHWDPEDTSAPYFACWHNMDSAPTIWGSSW